MTPAFRSPQEVPGLVRTIDVPADSFVYVSTHGGVGTNQAGDSATDVFLTLDGNRLQAAHHRLLPPPGLFQYWSISQVLTPSAGSHTFRVMTEAVSTGTGFVSGSSTSVLQGALTTLIIKQ